VESSCELSNEPLGSIKCWESTKWYSAPQLVMGLRMSMHVSFICMLCVLRLCMWNSSHAHVLSRGLSI
jgi:hypothetical protein